MIYGTSDGFMTYKVFLVNFVSNFPCQNMSQCYNLEKSCTHSDSFIDLVIFDELYNYMLEYSVNNKGLFNETF